MEFFELTETAKKVLLDILGYSVNKEGVIIEKETGKTHICKYTGEPVRFLDAAIMPGSTVIFNASPVTLSEYFEEYLNEGENGERVTTG